jgi:hypothetical protein
MMSIVSPGEVILDLSTVAQRGPSCVARIHAYRAAQTPEVPSWLTRAIAWCYEDWCAQQRMDDDGMAQPKGCTG